MLPESVLYTSFPMSLQKSFQTIPCSLIQGLPTYRMASGIFQAVALPTLSTGPLGT